MAWQRVLFRSEAFSDATAWIGAEAYNGELTEISRPTSN